MISPPPKKRETGFFREVWSAYNQLREFAIEGAVAPSGNRGVKVTRTSNGTLLRVEQVAKAIGGGQVVRFLLTSIQNDHLVCVNQETGESTLVAKPFNLRLTGWNGLAVAYAIENYPNHPTSPQSAVYAYVAPTYRTATVGGYTEHQVIRPHYVPSKSQIFAARCDSTGVTGCDWVDINADGRAWCMAT